MLLHEHQISHIPRMAIPDIINITCRIIQPPVAIIILGYCVYRTSLLSPPQKQPKKVQKENTPANKAPKSHHRIVPPTSRNPIPPLHLHLDHFPGAAPHHLQIPIAAPLYLEQNRIPPRRSRDTHVLVRGLRRAAGLAQGVRLLYWQGMWIYHCGYCVRGFGVVYTLLLLPTPPFFWITPFPSM